MTGRARPGSSMLRQGYVLRGTRAEDVAAAQAVVDAAQTARMGEHRRGEIEIAAECRDPRMDLAANTWVVEAPGGELAGFAFLFWSAAAQGDAETFVHPAHGGCGVDGALLDAVERRAAVLAGRAPAEAAAQKATPRLHVWCDAASEDRRRELAERGFRVIRESCLMRIDFDDEPPRCTALPVGLAVRPFAAGCDDEALWAATEEAFADHFLFAPSSIAEWRVHTVENPRFDPTLWLVAWAEDEVAGEALVFLDDREGYVDSLSVRRKWRGRGLGLGLLTRAFALAHARGCRKVRLGVDAQNPTGALALYLRAGMRVERREEVFAKDLRR